MLFRSIAGRIADETEDFDVNLWPGDTRKPSVASAEESSGEKTPRQTAQNPSDDHSVDNKDHPWNEGLSDFHWGGEMERVELE